MHIALQGYTPGRAVRVHVAASRFVWSSEVRGLVRQLPLEASRQTFQPSRSVYLNARTVPEEVLYVARRKEQGW